MKTDDLITLLAAQASPVDTGAAVRRYGVTVAFGVLVALLLMVTLVGVRDNLSSDASTAMFWVKLGFTAALFAGGWAATLRLSRPGTSLERLPALVAAPVIAIGALAVTVLIGAAPQQRTALVLGESWVMCSLMIAGLSVPVFVAALWGMKGLAPTRLALAGGAAGLLAGAAGAFVYALHCPELAAPFLAVWYVLGIALPAAVGAAVGPLVLRW